MNAERIDAIARLFAARRTRRATLGGGIGLAATALAQRAGRSAAQDATLAATPGATTDPHPRADHPAKPEFLFVQPFAGGTWAPKAGEDGVYSVTLSGAAANTIYFSDRPERVFGMSPTQRFLDGLGFTPADPPNAALVARQADGDGEDIVVIELFNPVYDAGTSTLTYDAKMLADYSGDGLKDAARRQSDYAFSAAFAEGSLFIDDCAALCGRCFIPGTPRNIGTIRIPTRYTGEVCDACNTDFSSAEYGQACAARYPDVCTYDATVGWNCHVAPAQIGGMC